VQPSIRFLFFAINVSRSIARVTNIKITRATVIISRNSFSSSSSSSSSYPSFSYRSSKTAEPATAIMIATSKMGLASNFTCALSVRSRFSSSSIKIAGKNLFSSKKEILLLQKKISRSHSSSSEQIARASMAKVGEQISGVLQLGPWTDGMPTAVNMAERCKGKKVFLIGLPGTL
jgi:hypothetical protein